jgi:hypothetical protein
MIVNAFTFFNLQKKTDFFNVLKRVPFRRKSMAFFILHLPQPSKNEKALNFFRTNSDRKKISEYCALFCGCLLMEAAMAE